MVESYGHVWVSRPEALKFLENRETEDAEPKPQFEEELPA
jgi:hypothetical protein